RIIGSVRQYSPRTRRGQRKLDAARKPVAQLGERLGVRLGHVGRGGGGRRGRRLPPQPVARRLSDRNVDAGLKPPVHQAVGRRAPIILGDRLHVPTHIPLSTKVDGAVKESQG